MAKIFKDNKLSNELKYLRGKENKKKFAKKIGVSYRTYLRYESGETQPKEPVMKVARSEFKNINIKLAEPHVEYTSLPDPIDQVMVGFAQLFKDNKKEFEKLHDMCKKVERKLSDLEEQLKQGSPGEAGNHEDITKKSAT